MYLSHNEVKRQETIGTVFCTGLTRAIQVDVKTDGLTAEEHKSKPMGNNCVYLNSLEIGLKPSVTKLKQPFNVHCPRKPTSNLA